MREKARYLVKFTPRVESPEKLQSILPAPWEFRHEVKVAGYLGALCEAPLDESATRDELERTLQAAIKEANRK